MIKLVLGLVLGLLPSLPVLQRNDDITVYQYTSSAWYYGEVYTRPPSGDATRVYFQGEPVWVKVQLHNESDAAVSLTDVRPVISQNFRFEVLGAPGKEVLGAPGNMVQHKFKEDFASTFELIPVTGRIISMPPSATIRLGARESLVMKFMIKTHDGGQLPEGFYKYRIRALLKVASREILVNNDDFGFEVRRVRSIDDRIEMLRREASEAVFLRGDAETAREKIGALLKLYPDSYVAYTLLGILEYNHRRLQSGIAAYEKALELMRSGKDTIVFKYQTKLLLDQAQGTVAATLDAWKGEQK